MSYYLNPDAFARQLTALAQRQGREVSGVIIDNRGRNTAMPIGFDLLSGSNQHLDFSGYFQGLTHLLQRRPDPPIVWFVNDSLLTKHAARAIVRRTMVYEAIVAASNVPVMAGKWDPYRALCLRSPWSDLDGYVSSFCMLLNNAALPYMQQLPSEAQAEGMLDDTPLQDPAWGERLPTAFREMIRAHLIYPASPLSWHAAVGADTQLLGKKARCVYFEHRLSGTIGNAGALLPINAGPRAALDIAVNEAWSKLWSRRGLRRR